MLVEAVCRAQFVDLNAEPLELDIWEITIMALSKLPNFLKGHYKIHIYKVNTN